MGPIMNVNKSKNSLVITIAVALVVALSSIPLVRKVWNKMSFINPQMFE
jgi:hypothetical protein